MKTLRTFFFISIVAILATSCGQTRYLVIYDQSGGIQQAQVVQAPQRRLSISAYAGYSPGYQRPVYAQPMQQPVVYGQQYYGGYGQQQRPVMSQQQYQMQQAYPQQQYQQQGGQRPVMSQQEYLEMRRRQGYNY